MPALGHNSEPVGSTKKSAETVPRHALAAREAMIVNAEHEAGKWTTSWRGPERTCVAVEAWVGPSAGLLSN